MLCSSGNTYWLDFLKKMKQEMNEFINLSIKNLFCVLAFASAIGQAVICIIIRYLVKSIKFNFLTFFLHLLQA